MSERLVPRVALIVCDSWGVGDAPDALAYGDESADTLGNTSRVAGGFRVPNLEALNFLLPDILAGGGSRSLRIDAQGKTLGMALLEMPVNTPKF